MIAPIRSTLVIRSLDVRPQVMLTGCHRLHGEVPERSNGAVSKTVVPLTGGPRVRIPPSPPIPRFRSFQRVSQATAMQLSLAHLAFLVVSRYIPLAHEEWGNEWGKRLAAR